MKEPYWNPLNPAPLRYYFQSPDGTETFYTLQHTKENEDEYVWQIFEGRCPKQCGKLLSRVETSQYGNKINIYTADSENRAEVSSAQLMFKGDTAKDKVLYVSVD